jgi:hypothetical protein
MIGALELFLISFGLTYYLATTGAGVLVMRRQGWGREKNHCGDVGACRLRTCLPSSVTGGLGACVGC